MDILQLLMLLIPIDECIRTKKLRKLIYVPIMLYFFIGIPFLEFVTEDKIILLIYLVIGCLITFLFGYLDIYKFEAIQTKKQ
ncbi:MAG TPA: hypothetical protein DIU45_20030 [Clostridium sp.]|nr:hypothetical protein [Clostridium sp.]